MNGQVWKGETHGRNSQAQDLYLSNATCSQMLSGLFQNWSAQILISVTICLKLFITREQLKVVGGTLCDLW